MLVWERLTETGLVSSLAMLELRLIRKAERIMRVVFMKNHPVRVFNVFLAWDRSNGAFVSVLMYEMCVFF